MPGDQRPARCRRRQPADHHGRDHERRGAAAARRSRGPPPAPVIAPMYIWPSAPMLKSFIRNAAAAARPVKASGVAVISVWSSEPGLQEPRLEQLAVGRERVVARSRAGRWPATTKANDDRADRHREREPARLAQPALDA